jgi:hypothetical protein
MDNNLQVEFSLRTDKSGAKVLTELRLYYPESEDTDLPLGGITAKVLRSVSLYDLKKRWLNEGDFFRLSVEQEEILLDLLRNYPSKQGRVPVPAIYLAGIAYLYESALRKSPQPNKYVGHALGARVRTIATRVSKARKEGFLENGEVARRGGLAKGQVSDKAKKVLEDYLSTLPV